MSMFGLAGFLIKNAFSQKALEKKVKKENETKFDALKARKELYDREIKPYYEETQHLFNRMCKAGQITSDELYLLRVLIEDCLGVYKQQYKSMKFKNEFHRIYTYLKSWYLDKMDFLQIQAYLEEISQNSDEVTH